MSAPPEDFTESMRGLRKRPQSVAELFEPIYSAQQTSVQPLAFPDLPEPVPERDFKTTTGVAPLVFPDEPSETIPLIGGEVPVQKYPYLTKKVINRPSSSPEALHAALSIRSGEAKMPTKDEFEKMLEPAFWQSALLQLEFFDYPRGLTWAALSATAGAVTAMAATANVARVLLYFFIYQIPLVIVNLFLLTTLQNQELSEVPHCV